MNINGLHSAWEAHLKRYVRELKADVFCMQETRMGKDLDQYFVPGYEEYWCPSDRPGYAGVGLFTSRRTLSVIQGLGVPERADEGRAVTLELAGMYVVNVYAPASGADLERLPEKVAWMNALCRYVEYLEARKPVVICGDLNIAGGVLDMPLGTDREQSAGNTSEEKEAFNRLVGMGYYDVWRLSHSGIRGVSWVPPGTNERWAEQYGMRLDYFLVSEKLLGRVRSCEIQPQTAISDHRCVVLDMR